MDAVYGWLECKYYGQILCAIAGDSEKLPISIRAREHKYEYIILMGS